MLQASLEGLSSLLTMPVLLVILLGVLIGAVFGFLPGIGGVVGVAVLLPFTYNMEPISAFAFLLAVSTVLATTGDFTSILFGVPGDGAAASTVLDGHPMAKAGEAGRALASSTLSSTAGAIFGALVLVLLLPVVRPLVLHLGSPDFFMLTVLGLAFIGSVSFGQPLKGVTSALLGVLLGTVGLDPALGLPRYTFGSLELWDGLSLAAVALAFFAVPELINLIGTRKALRAVQGAAGVARGARDVLDHKWLVLRSSAIGTAAGVLPGLGAASAQWIAYGHAVQTSKDKGRFGRGAPEGIIASGAANHSGLGASMLPTVAFGIPGSVIAAMLLGAFLVQGLVPGPDMLTTQLPLTMSFAWAIVLANIMAVALFFPTFRYMAKATSLRASWLVPLITVVVYLGAYVEQGSLFGGEVVIVLGAVATVMVRLDWPRAPLLLGVVLGKIAEGYFNISYERYGMSFLGRPTVIFIGLLALLVLFAPLLQILRNRRQRRGIEVSMRSGPRAKVRGEALGYLGLIVIGVAAGSLTLDWNVRSALMPRVVCVAIILLALAGLTNSFARLLRLRTNSRQLETITASHESSATGDEPSILRDITLSFVWLIVAYVTIRYLGFILGSSILVGAYAVLVGRERVAISAVAALSTGAAMWGIVTVLSLVEPTSSIVSF